MCASVLHIAALRRKQRLLITCACGSAPRRVTFELVPGQVPLLLRQGITMGPKHGVRVRPVRRR